MMSRANKKETNRLEEGESVMNAKEFMDATYKRDVYNIRPRAVCADGFSMSIQGGTRGHYCVPRKLCREYQKVEIGFPSEIEPLLLPYAEEEETPTETVYGFVEMDVVEEVVKKHGGIIDYAGKED